LFCIEAEGLNQRIALQVIGPACNGARLRRCGKGNLRKSSKDGSSDDCKKCSAFKKLHSLASKANIRYPLRESAERLFALRHHEAYTGRGVL
jgi:hypothetical protein